MIKEILAKLQESVIVCDLTEKELTTKLAEANSLAAQQKTLVQELADKGKLLDTREAAVKKIEDIVAYKVQADETLVKGNTLMNEANTRIKALGDYQNTVQAEISAKMTKLLDLKATLEGKEKDLAAREEALKAKIESYQAEVKAKIKAQLG